MIMSAEEFVALRISDRIEDNLRAANEQADDEVWLDVIETYPDMLRWVAHNRTVSASILDVLADKGDAVVRCMVATKPDLGVETFGKLAADPVAAVRTCTACNVNVPTSILEQLKSDEDEEVAGTAGQRLTMRQQNIKPSF